MESSRASERGTVVYGPESRLGRQRRITRDMRDGLRRCGPHARHLLARELRRRYLDSRLGWLWAVAPAVVLAFWATLAQRAAILTVGAVAIAYPAWVLLSLTLWQTFAEALTSQVEGLASERRLLAQLELPPEGLILARAGETLFGFLVKSVVVLAALLVYGVELRWTLLLLPLLVLPILLLGTALGLVLAPLAALYRDISRALPTVLMLWFFLTPVFFAMPRQGLFRILALANPVTPQIGFARDLAAAGIVSHPIGATMAAAFTLLLLPAGWYFYRLALPYVFERTEG